MVGDEVAAPREVVRVRAWRPHPSSFSTVISPDGPQVPVTSNVTGASTGQSRGARGVAISNQLVPSNAATRAMKANLLVIVSLLCCSRLIRESGRHATARTRRRRR